MTRPGWTSGPARSPRCSTGLAERYDLLNDVLSLGQDRRWRKVVASAVGATAGQRVLDLAAGTGTSSRAFTGAGAQCVACDFSLGMLGVGRAQASAPAAVASWPVTRWRCRSADASFDAVTISFGLRNVADTDAGLAEMLRVTRPGGRLVICEFSHLPRPAPGRAVRAGTWRPCCRWSRGGCRATPEAYDYLAESIAGWPAQAELARRIGAAGWSAVGWRNLTLGVVALHTARRADSGSGRRSRSRLTAEHL